MIKIKLDDLNVVENLKAIKELRKAKLFNDKELQEMYNEQVKADLEKSYKGGFTYINPNVKGGSLNDQNNS